MLVCTVRATTTEGLKLARPDRSASPQTRNAIAYIASTCRSNPLSDASAKMKSIAEKDRCQSIDLTPAHYEREHVRACTRAPAGQFFSLDDACRPSTAGVHGGIRAWAHGGQLWTAVGQRRVCHATVMKRRRMI